jgi:adenylate cyclase
VDDLDTVLLGARPDLTRLDVIEQSGVAPELADAVWNALGFASVGDDVRAFTANDVQALRNSQQLIASGLVDPDTWLVMARTMGQALSRLAEAQIDVFGRVLGDLEPQEAIEVALAAAEHVVPPIEQLLLFVWRRQFAAAAHRTLAGVGQHDQPTITVGFLDLVDFTRSTRSWDVSTLEQTLEVFERDTALRVAAMGGRVIKTLGDGVLFAASDPVAAVQVALDTVQAHLDDGELPLVRAGLASGPVLERLGDLYGEPVNIASRLADEARASSVLVDRVLAQRLEGADGLVVRPLAKRSVRGYRSLTPFLVRRATPAS